MYDRVRIIGVARGGSASELPSRARVSMEVGEILRIDDALTGFDDNKVGRPCMVVRLETHPRSGGWVLPRSTRPPGTKTPGGLLPGLDRDGWFMYLPYHLVEADLETCPSVGVLPEPYRTAVLDNVNGATLGITL